MNLNQFKLYCINLVAKNEGKMLSEVFSQSRDNVVLSLERMYFYTQFNRTHLQISSLAVISLQSGRISIWGGNTKCGEWITLEKPKYEDFV